MSSPLSSESSSPTNGDIMHKLYEMEIRMNSQFAYLKKQIKTHGELLERLTTRKELETPEPAPDQKLVLFPLNTLDEVEEVDRYLAEFSKTDLMNYVKSCVCEKPIAKCLPMIFGHEVLMKINWDGRQRKFPIKSLKFFSEMFFDAIKKPDDNYHSFEIQMRKGFRNYKNQLYRIKFNSKREEEFKF